MNLADLSPLANHLWQSTLFAAFAALLTLAGLFATHETRDENI